MPAKYAKESDNPSKSCKTRGTGLRVHFKNTREAANAIKGMTLKRAKRYLKNVLAHKEIIPFTRFMGGVSRKAHCKQFHCKQGRYPTKSVKVLQDLLTNAESNAEFKGLDMDVLTIKHIQVERAQKGRRRTYRAHGRINAYMSSPCHVELFLEEEQDAVLRPIDEQEEDKKKKKVSKKKQARERARAGFSGGD